MIPGLMLADDAMIARYAGKGAAANGRGGTFTHHFGTVPVRDDVSKGAAAQFAEWAGSGDNVGDQIVFDQRHLVLEVELAFLQPRDLQLVCRPRVR